MKYLKKNSVPRAVTKCAMTMCRAGHECVVTDCAAVAVRGASADGGLEEWRGGVPVKPCPLHAHLWLPRRQGHKPAGGESGSPIDSW